MALMERIERTLDQMLHSIGVLNRRTEVMPHDLPKNDESRALRERSVYLRERIEHLKEELRSLQLARPEIIDSLRSMPDKTSPEAKTLKRRRIYVRSRPTEVKKEIAAAVAERRSIAEQLAGPPIGVENRSA